MDANEILLYEHKIIYSLLNKLKIKIEEIKKTRDVQGNFIDLLTDFFITYIDVYHHGKEENLMFEILKQKHLTVHHKNSMNLLIEQHDLGRKLIEKIIITSANYFKIKDQDQITKLIELLTQFHKTYIEHAQFEDNIFFKEVTNYFTEEEKEQLTQDFFKFNIKMINEKYKTLIDML
jgi:hemerythrin-like domain-containing protein